MTDKVKQVGFYRIFVLDRAQRRPVDVNWAAQLADFASRPMADRSVDHTVYEPRLDGDRPVLGVHALIKPDYMTAVDEQHATITDLMEEAARNGPGRLANSTACLFLRDHNAVAIATGSNSSPKPPAVLRDFLQVFYPQAPGVHWDVQPIMDIARLKEFRDDARGVQRLETRITTVRDLFSPSESDGVVRFADELADRIGGDVVVELKVSLAPEARNTRARRNFKRLLMGDLPRIATNQVSKTKVTALLAGEVQEELSLVASRLGATITLDTADTESRTFSGLVDHLRRVGGEMEDRVTELLEG